MSTGDVMKVHALDMKEQCAAFREEIEPEIFRVFEEQASILEPHIRS